MLQTVVEYFSFPFFSYFVFFFVLISKHTSGFGAVSKYQISLVSHLSVWRLSKKKKIIANFQRARLNLESYCRDLNPNPEIFSLDPLVIHHHFMWLISKVIHQLETMVWYGSSDYLKFSCFLPCKNCLMSIQPDGWHQQAAKARQTAQTRPLWVIGHTTLSKRQLHTPTLYIPHVTVYGYSVILFHSVSAYIINILIL